MPVVVGGIHGTLYDKHLLYNNPINFIVRGEGEQPLPQLLDYLAGKRKLEGICGISYLNDKNELVRHPEAELLSGEDIGNLPVPAYDLLPDGVYESLSIESSRGCHFNCTFCSIPFHKKWRAMSASRFVDKIEKIQPYLKRCKIQAFSLIDDCFTTNKTRVKEIIRLIEKRGIEFEASLDARCPDIKDLQFAKTLGKITNMLLFGAESGYDEGLKRIQKKQTTESIERAAKLVSEAGYSSRASIFFYHRVAGGRL